MSKRAYQKIQQKKQENAHKRYEKERIKNSALAKPGVHDFIVVLDNLKAGFNVPKIFRSAEAFGAHAVYLVNVGEFDPAPAKGSFRKVPVYFFDSFADCYQQLSEHEYSMFAFEADAKQTLPMIDFPTKTAIILGNEEQGLSFDPAQYPDIQPISIPQYADVQSLNVSIAASIAMYELTRKTNREFI